MTEKSKYKYLCAVSYDTCEMSEKKRLLDKINTPEDLRKLERAGSGQGQR